MSAVKHLNAVELEAGMATILESPKEQGAVKLIVRRPDVGQREVLEKGELDAVEGLIGDNWKTRGSSKIPDGQPHPGMQVNLMNARVIALLASTKDRWPLAGDQLYIDLDLSEENLPTGTRLAIGSAELETTGIPHTGCKKFLERFGLEAAKFVNSKLGRQLNLRGINAKIIRSGVVSPGDMIKKLI